MSGWRFAKAVAMRLRSRLNRPGCWPAANIAELMYDCAALPATLCVVVPAVSTGLGLKRRFDRLNRGTQTFHHLAQHIIVGNAHPVLTDL